MKKVVERIAGTKKDLNGARETLSIMYAYLASRICSGSQPMSCNPLGGSNDTFIWSHIRYLDHNS